MIRSTNRDLRHQRGGILLDADSPGQPGCHRTHKHVQRRLPSLDADCRPHREHGGRSVRVDERKLQRLPRSGFDLPGDRRPDLSRGTFRDLLLRGLVHAMNPQISADHGLNVAGKPQRDRRRKRRHERDGKPGPLIALGRWGTTKVAGVRARFRRGHGNGPVATAKDDGLAHACARAHRSRPHLEVTERHLTGNAEPREPPSCRRSCKAADVERDGARKAAVAGERHLIPRRIGQRLQRRLHGLAEPGLPARRESGNPFLEFPG